MNRSIDELLSDEPATEELAGDNAITLEALEGPTEGLTGEGEPPRLEQPRGPDGKFTKQTGDEPQEAEATPATNPIPEDQFKGYLTEKRKRQELEQQIAEMREQFAQFQAQSRSSQPQEPEPDFWDNPQGVIASQVQRAVMEALQAKEQQQQLARINESEAKAKAAYADYDDAFRAFQQAAAANPSLIQQMTAASDPAEFAYKKGKTALQLEQVGSIDEIIAKRLADERAKWEAEVKAAVPQPSFPSTTATDGSVGARSGPAWSGPAPLTDLLR